ncbi:MAG: hypothetical protein WC821_01925 [archaeon]|jgi:tRNA A-37 threonylcarbamoyl transferase component Bud32
MLKNFLTKNKARFDNWLVPSSNKPIGRIKEALIKTRFKLGRARVKKRLEKKEKLVIRRGKELGEGVEGTVYQVSVRKKGTLFRKGAAQKKFFSYGNWHPLEKQVLVKNKRIWRKLKDAGLPVPSFYAVDLRKYSRKYKTVLMEDLTKKFGEIIPVNSDIGLPVKLGELKIPRDQALLSELGKDLAVMHNHNLFSDTIDFWGFYKKGESHGRVIIDYSRMFEEQTYSVQSAVSQITIIRDYCSSKAGIALLESYFKNLKDQGQIRKIKKALTEVYRRKRRTNSYRSTNSYY